MSVAVQTRESVMSVSEAAELIAPYVVRTPLTPYSPNGLNGNELYVKDEGRQRAATFKSRGAVALMHVLREQSVTELVTASAGNAGAGYAYGANQLGMQVDVVVPFKTAPSRIENIKRMGGDAVRVIEAGRVVDESVLFAQKRALSLGKEYAPPFDHAVLPTGQGTMTLEALDQAQSADRLFVQVGGGSALAGALLAVEEMGSDARVVAVQYEGNNSMELSARAGEVVCIPSVDTLCEGTSVKAVGEHTLSIVMRNLDKLEFMSVSKEQLGESLVHEDRWRQELVPIYGHDAYLNFPETTGMLAIAGAKAYAQQHPEIRGEKWIAMMTGANSDASKVDAAIDAYYRSLPQNFHRSPMVARQVC